MKYFYLTFSLFVIISCKEAKPRPIEANQEVLTDSTTTKDFREFKVLDSKYLSNNEIWKALNTDLSDFSETDYNNLKPLILEQPILKLQEQIAKGNLTYEGLTKFYLYRIRAFDRENPSSLNSVIALNPSIIKEAKQKDKELLNKKTKHPIFGMPILLKDNINTQNIATTAGAVALLNNTTPDAFVTKQLKQHGALILGKANLSEWAYFFCGDCPSGYSAVGGQTLNPYGRRTIDTGGSSSGSGVAVAANFCVAAVGSETSGSILSPSSQNAVVGLKPTIGLLSRSGIIPISSTLDTPGPMTKFVGDNAILLDAMQGFDENDSKSVKPKNNSYYKSLVHANLKGKRFGAFKRLVTDSLYKQAVAQLEAQGAEIIEIEEEAVKLPNFIRLLNLDMKADLPKYLSEYANDSMMVSSVADVVNYNKKDSLNSMPYGQKLFLGILKDEASQTDFQKIKDTLKTNGRQFFNVPMKAFELDGVLSINNYHAGFAAVAEYPAITVPMGFTENGSPKGLTFISKPFTEQDLLQWAYSYEQASKKRKPPVNY